MTRIHHEFCSTFTPAMDALRRQGYPGPGYAHTAHEAADDHSTHLVLQDGETLVAYMRLAPAPYNTFRPGAGSEVAVPEGDQVLLCNRMVVAPDYRRRHLVDLLTYLTVERARQQGYHYLIGALRPTAAPLLATAQRFGLLPGPAPFDYHHPSGRLETVVPVVCDLQQTAPAWPAVQPEVQSRLQEHGIAFSW